MDRTLASGRGHLTTDPFSPYHETPGWWTEATVGDASVPRLFTVLVFRNRRWIRPVSRTVGRDADTIDLLHSFDGHEVPEKRGYAPGGAACSRFDFLALPRDYSVVQWALLPHAPPAFGNPWCSLDDPVIRGDRIEAVWRRAWPTSVEAIRDGVAEARAITREMGPIRALPFVLGGSTLGIGSVRVAENHATAPDGRLLSGGFPPEMMFPPALGLAHLSRVLRAGRVLLWAGLACEDPGSDPFGDARRTRESWSGGWADLRTEDPLLRTVHASRIEAYRRNRIDLPVLGIAAGRPFPTEGPGFFRNFVTFSAQCHLRDLANRKDPDEAVAILDNLVAIQRDDGSLPGHNYGDRASRDHYHADFATGARRVFERGALEREHLSMLRRYADWLVRERSWGDPAGPNLVVVINQNETGMEYMSRYDFFRKARDPWENPDGDPWQPIRMGAVESTVFAVRLCNFIAEMRPVDSVYRSYAEGYRRGLAELSYDPRRKWFCDVNAAGDRAPGWPGTGLLALLVDPRPEVAKNLRRFVSGHGIPSEAYEDKRTNGEGIWRGLRMNCPWNGRSWPMLNAFMVEAVRRIDPVQGERWFRKALKLHEDGSSWEHYSPSTGEGSEYRGVNDYLHNHLLDLIYQEANYRGA